MKLRRLQVSKMIVLGLLMAVMIVGFVPGTVNAADTIKLWRTDWAEGYTEFTAVKSGRYIFYATRYTGLMRYDTVKKKTKVIDKLGKSEYSMAFEHLEAADGYIYYGKSLKKTYAENLYRIKADGSGKEKLADKLDYYCFKDGRIYCYNGENVWDDEEEDYVYKQKCYSIDMNGQDKRDEVYNSDNLRLTMGDNKLKSTYMKLSGRGDKYSNKRYKDAPFYANKKISFKVTNLKNNKKWMATAYGGYLTYNAVDDYVMYISADGTKKTVILNIYVQKYNGKGKRKIKTLKCKNMSGYYSY